MRSLGIRLGIIAVIVIGFVILRPFISGSAGDLALGDCFDPPPDTTETVTDVQHHPCTDVHHGEVIYVGKVADQATYPTDAEFKQVVQDTCLPAYTAYAGADLFTTEDADVGYFVPTSDGWSKGDRALTCYATKLDNLPMQGSIKKG
jgi:hypothetical protein